MRTGIADYSEHILRLLAPHYRCTVVMPDGLAAQAPPEVCVVGLADYLADAGLQAALHLYHIGNNPDHVYMLPILARRPGVVVLHDPGLHHLLDCATAALGDQDGYCAALEAEYGAPGRTLGEQYREHELRDGLMLYGMPMLRHLLGPALHVVTHSRTAAHRAMSHAPQTPVTIVPHPFAPVGAAGDSFRHRHGIAEDELVFLSLGFVSHIKRIDVALRALRRIAEHLPPFRYVIAGELKPEEIDIERLVARLGLEANVVITGYLPEAQMGPAIAAGDVVINLRHPVGGETSGTLIRCLGEGACVVVTDEGPFAEIPDGAAVKLGWGPDMEAELAAVLLDLARDAGRRKAVGEAARRYTTRHNHEDATRGAYLAALGAAAVAVPRPWRAVARFAYAPPGARPGEGVLWQRLGAVPHRNPPGPCVFAGTAAERQAIAGLGHVAVLPADWAGMERRGADSAFVSLKAGDGLLDRPTLLAEINRPLSHGGVLVLCIEAGHVLAERGAGERVLRAAGFRVDLAGSAPPPGLAAVPPGVPQMVWRATKVSDA